MTTSSDLNQKVLDAFQVEHREQLEQMRALLADMGPDADLSGDARITEAFRMAHSFKGGARVCGLKPAEQLGHSLEAVLEQLAGGKLRADEEVIATINQVLDTIEDWMIALRQQENPCDTTGTLERINRLLDGESLPAAALRCPPEFMAKLRETFRCEYAENVQHIRRLLERWKSSTAQPPAHEVSEAGRLTHSLVGAASAAGEERVAFQAKSLETFLGHGDHLLEATSLSQLEKLLDAMDAEMHRGEAAPTETTPHQGTPSLEDSFEPSPKEIKGVPESSSASAEQADVPSPSHKKSTTSGSTESVRVSVSSLDRLLRSAGRLLVESHRQERLTLELSQLRKHIDELERWQDSIHRSAAASIRHAGPTNLASEHLSRYLQDMEQRIHGLAHLTRQICMTQQRTAWMFSAQTRQVQQDVHAARMVPAESVFQGFRKMVRDLAKDEGKQIDLHVSGFDVRADRLVLQALKDPLMHMLRNCVTHGIELPGERIDVGKAELGHVKLSIQSAGNQLSVTIEDDGRGIDARQLARMAVKRGLLSEAGSKERSEAELAELAFEAGLTTSKQVTELAGRGMGLSIVHQAVERLQGQIQLVPRTAGGTCFRITVPTSVSTHRLLTVTSGGQHFAIPIRGIERLLRLPRKELETVEGRPVVIYNDRPLPLVWLDWMLNLSRTEEIEAQEFITVLILSSGAKQTALVVDGLVGERDSLVQSLGEEVGCREATGAVVLDDGQVALVLNPQELLDRAHVTRERIQHAATTLKEEPEPPSVLVVDDSFTTRTLEKSILEAQGYRVSVAVDGIEALAQLQRTHFDLVISDVEMPGMDGFRLLEHVKSDHRLRETPVILVTSRDRQEDQIRGLHLGAEAYIIKRKFDHQDLLSTIEQVL